MDEADNISGLRVLITADTVGGVWTYAVELCQALSGSGIHFHLVTMGAKMQSWQRQQISGLANVTVYETTYKLEWMDDPWDDVDRAGFYLKSLQKAVQADIIHLNGYVHGALDWDVPVVMVAHSDVYSWWRAVKNDVPGSAWATYFNKVKKGLSEANHIVAPSRAMMTALESVYSLKKNHSIIYNSRNTDLFYRGTKEKTVLCMGRIWDEAKNVRLILDAAERIGYPVKIAGDYEFDGNTLDMAQKNVCFLGKLPSEQIAKQLSSASIYVLPAKYEPFGLSALEAALSGCALVLGDIDSLREIWQDSAVYVDPDDDSQLAEVINALMQDQSRLEDLAAKAAKRAKTFSVRKMASQYQGLYRQLIYHNKPLAVK